MVWLLIGRGHSLAALLAAGIIVLSLSDIAIRVISRGLRDKLAISVVLHALACRIALAPQSAKATFDALAGSHLKFIVTDKFGSQRRSIGHLKLCHLLLFATALALLIGMPDVNSIVFAALLILMLPLPAALMTDRSLRAYRETIAPSVPEVVA